MGIVVVMASKNKKRFGIQLHVTRNEVLEWLNDWSTQFGIDWRECSQTINDLSVGKTTDLGALLKKNKELRLVLLKSPIPKSLVVDAELLDGETFINLVVFDVGRKTPKGLYESYLTGDQTKKFLPVIKYVKARTKSGARLKGETSVDRAHRYSEEAMRFSDKGVSILDDFGEELELCL